MPLPKMSSPTYELTIPSTEKVIKYRPFLVKEEKILLQAAESDNPKDSVNAMRQIINNCVIDDIEVDRLPVFDIEYLFLQLRARSVSNQVVLTLPLDNCDQEKCPKSIQQKVDIDEIKVVKNPNHKQTVELGNNVSVKFKYPTIEIATSIAGSKDGIDEVFKVMADSIEYIHDGTEMYKREDYTQQEFLEFMNSLTQGQFLKMREFFDTMPKLSKEVNYSCPVCGKKYNTVLEGLMNFFG